MIRKVLIIIGILTINGCAGPGINTDQIKDRIEISNRLIKNVEIRGDIKEDNGEYVLKLRLVNPDKKDIISVRSWLTYNPEFLEVKKLDDQFSDFDLSAPGENIVDTNLGIIKIGRSITTGYVNEGEIIRVVFTKKTDDPNFIELYDYGDDSKAHTRVNTIYKNDVYNVLNKPDGPIATIK